MNVSDIATRKDLIKLESTGLKILKLLSSNSSDREPIGYIPLKKFKELTGFGDATIWRLINSHRSIMAYKFPGSNRKFFKISEINEVLEKGIINE